MSKLIKKIAQKVIVDYCRLSIVENPDGFLTQETVRNLLDQHYGIEVICGSNLKLRIHYELHYKMEPEKRFIYVCNSLETLLADMKQEAYTCEFSASDLFPLFADKSLIRKQPLEVLEELNEKVGIRKLSMLECTTVINNIHRYIEERKLSSTEFLKEQLIDIEIDWNNTASTIASVSKIMTKAIKEDVYDGISSYIDNINERFQIWIDSNYFATLQSNHLIRPKSVNKILPHIADNYERDDKVALMVVDGFAYWQYLILKDRLKEYDFNIKDNSTLAWMPSITMLSRQAIFRGSTPLLDYKQNPENEKRLWYDYWRGKGFGTYEIQYLYDNEEFAINEGVKRLAIVTVEMDEKMHSSTDYKDLHSLTENWSKRILDQIKTIVQSGFTLYLTTDHGSVLSTGWRPLTQVEKVFLYKDGSRGMRHLIYNNNVTEQERFYADNLDINLIKHDNWMSIRDSRCFAKENKTMITHGGSHFLEMVIPFVKITTKQ